MANRKFEFDTDGFQYYNDNYVKHPSKSATTGTSGAHPYNGMGRVVLKKNMVSNVNTLTQTMINTANTIYIIRYDFVLGEDITIPENCILEFDGGSISGNGTGKNTITMLSGFIVGGLFNDIQIVSNGGVGIIELKRCKFNITSDIIALQVSGNPPAEKNNIISECVFTGTFGDNIGQAIKLGSTNYACVNTTIEKCLFSELNNAITLINEVDHLYIRNNHFLRNNRDIYTEDGLTTQKAHICIIENHFQMGANDWKCIEMAADSLFIEKNEIQTANATNATFIKIGGGDNIIIKETSGENFNSQDYSNVKCICLALVSNCFIENCKIDGQFDSLVEIYDTVFSCSISDITNSAIGGSANTIIRNKMSSALANTRCLILNRAYSIDGIYGCVVSPGTIIGREESFTVSGNTDSEHILSNFVNAAVEAVKVSYIGVNYGSVGEFVVNLNSNSGGTIINNNLNYSYDASTKRLSFINTSDGNVLIRVEYSVFR